MKKTITIELEDSDMNLLAGCMKLGINGVRQCGGECGIAGNHRHKDLAANLEELLARLLFSFVTGKDAA